MPFDLNDPPDRPPAGVAHPLLWRLATRLLRDHSPGPGGAGSLVRCRACGSVWPCECRRFAERALIDAYESPAAHGPTMTDADSDHEGPASGAIDAGSR